MRKLMLVLGAAAVVGCGGVSKETYGAKEAEAAKYKQEVAALQQQNAELQARSGELEKKLSEAAAAKSEAQASSAKLAEQREEAKTIRLTEQLLFKENSSKLTPECKRALDSIADAVAQVKDKSVIVLGFTDDAESAGKDAKARRWQLSTARALAVAKYLVGRGVDPALIGVAGFGETRPVAPNDSMANRALNRRAEIALTPSGMDVGTAEVERATLKTK